MSHKLRIVFEYIKHIFTSFRAMWLKHEKVRRQIILFCKYKTLQCQVYSTSNSISNIGLIVLRLCSTLRTSILRRKLKSIHVKITIATIFPLENIIEILMTVRSWPPRKSFVKSVKAFVITLLHFGTSQIVIFWIGIRNSNDFRDWNWIRSIFWLKTFEREKGENDW